MTLDEFLANREFLRLYYENDGAKDFKPIRDIDPKTFARAAFLVFRQKNFFMACKISGQTKDTVILQRVGYSDVIIQKRKNPSWRVLALSA